MQKIAILYDASQAVLSTFDLDEVLNQMTISSPQQVMLEVRFVEASREAWFEGQLDLDPKKLVFIDESVLQSNGRRSA